MNKGNERIFDHVKALPPRLWKGERFDDDDEEITMTKGFLDRLMNCVAHAAYGAGDGAGYRAGSAESHRVERHEMGG